MRHTLKLFLLTLCILAAAQHPANISAQEVNSPVVNQAVGSLVARLKGARTVMMPRGNYSVRLSSVRAEGCVLRYEITLEFEQIGRFASADRPQDANGTIYRSEDEWKVNLADLDPSRVIARSNMRMKAGAAGVSFYAEGGREVVSRTYQHRTRLGVWMRTQQSSFGYFPLLDEGGLEGVAESLRHAIAVCKNPSS